MPERNNLSSQQWWLIGTVVAVSAASILYRVLTHQGLNHSAAMFVGIPALLAILLALLPKSNSITGGVLKGITFALLIVAPLLGEGVVCILMASPLFYLVGVVVGAIADRARRQQRGKSATLSCVALVLLPLSLEGVVPALTPGREQQVESTRILSVPVTAVEARLAGSPDVHLPLPVLLRLFPHPLASVGQGIALGDTRTIRFSGAEGMGPGDLVFRVAESHPGYVRFTAVSDHTKVGQWLHWQQSEVSWHALDSTHTAVTWRIGFTRELDPAWYFAPWERAVVRRVAGYLIEANAAPAHPA